MNNVILIDDDLNFKELFIAEAQRQAIPLDVIHKSSFDGLTEVLPKYSRSAMCVVLDVKCLMSDDQAKEDLGFISSAITYLDTHCSKFPRLILTGDDESFNTLPNYYKNENIYQKTPNGLREAFKKLNYYRENSKDIQIRSENSDVFSLFRNKYYSHIDEILLLNILRNIDCKDFSKFGGILRDVRAMQETIYKTINKVNVAVVPNAMLKTNGMIEFNKLMKHLNGNPPKNGDPATTTVYQNSAIFNLANSLYWASGKYIHSDPLETYFISNYTLRSLVYALLEILLWSRKYVEK